MFLGCLLIVISASSSAASDILHHRFHESIFKNLNDLWWDPTFSWRNKYKRRSPYLGPKFFGSTTIFLFLTDASSMFNFIHINALISGLFFITIEMHNDISIAIIFIMALIHYKLMYIIFYSKVFKSL